MFKQKLSISENFKEFLELLIYADPKIQKFKIFLKAL